MEKRVNEQAAGAPVVRLTEKAVEAVKRTLATQKLEGHRLKVALRPGGCAGFQYDLDVVERVGPGDLAFEQDGVGIIVDAGSAHFLAGTEIDYVDDGLHAGFAFQNPNARTSCGCGSSFQA
ncbi:MAG: iron-sulfur cluster assembly accessory protein [Deltaproteobacteria bacterium]|nr:iron-sulfur cluster assembly accessory protein [Deltaproteobacteria bacterium]